MQVDNQSLKIGVRMIKEEEAIRAYKKIGLDCCGNCKYWKKRWFKNKKYCSEDNSTTQYTDSCPLWESK